MKHAYYDTPRDIQRRDFRDEIRAEMKRSAAMRARLADARILPAK